MNFLYQMIICMLLCLMVKNLQPELSYIHFTLGHGGAGVSAYAQAQSYLKFTQMTQLDEAKVKSNDEISRILTQSLLAVDKDLENNRMLRSQGCTACVVYFNNVGDKTSIITANVGDSRAVLSRNHTAIDLSVDHKPDLPSERARIEALGGSVDWAGRYDEVTGLPIKATGVYRVNRILALSRSIGLRLLLLFNPSTSPSVPQETWT
jgi:serine/threonine protein phosphatase PrpC